MAKKDGLFEEDRKNEIEEDEEYDPEIYTLTDEDGNELQFALLGELEHEGEVYLALIPVDEDGEEASDEYVILKRSTDENGEETLDTIEDDDEFDRIADIFDDEFADIFYDED
ncbi:MAG: DUF1292 domain-containing protein [Clostridia bacterium]|jgi:Protein of unknown function (DUF1292).|nr:DUF1292 domain-containing protein [Clostridia bacterium]